MDSKRVREGERKRRVEESSPFSSHLHDRSSSLIKALVHNEVRETKEERRRSERGGDLQLAGELLRC